MHRKAFLACTVAVLLLVAAAARADVSDYIGKTIASVRLVIESVDVNDPDLVRFVATSPGAALSMVDVRDTVSRLFSLGRFEDIRVHAEADGARVRLMYDLVPVHPVDRISFTGDLSGPGVDTGQLRRDLVDRYGASPPVGRAPDLVRVVEDDLHAEGYLHAAVIPHAELRHAPDRATLVLDVQPGPRASIGAIDITGTPGLSREEMLKLLNIAPGAPYRTEALTTRISRYLDNRRSQGYFEAKLTTAARFEEGDRVVNLTLDAIEGPLVRVVFRGDPLPPDRRSGLVLIEQEGSADEDLLEDSSNRIEAYLRAQGYRDASAPHARDEQDGELAITFTVTKGPLYRVAKVQISGNTAIPLAVLSAGLRVHETQPFSEARMDADVTAIEELYRRQGFTTVRVQGDDEAAPHEATAAEVPVTVHIDITENVRTLVNTVHVSGNQTVPEADLTRDLGLQPGRPLFLTQLAVDRDAILQAYANRGFESATVDSNPGLSGDRSRADVVFTVREGPQLFVDHILIVGNVRTKTDTIQRELQFKTGDPLGQSALNESQRRLASLGLFRRTEITTIARGENQRDVLIRIDESPATTISYGGGIEADEKAVGEGGVATTRLEIAPRAFFEVGRRNLFGKNRSVNLFTRFGLRPKDSPVFSQQQTLLQTTGGEFGFAEYRVLGTFREPHVFGSQADAFVTGTLEQAVRSSFDFSRSAINVEVGRRVTRAVSLSGNYQIQRVRLFNDVTPLDQQLLVDRTFPQIRLSSFSASVIDSTRNDPLDPTSGVYLSANAQLAARAIGSEVGFLKSYMRAQWFHALPHGHGVVLATNATLGLAGAFVQQVLQPDGTTQDVDPGLPASERFFAGGDTTVRGFGLDQLGIVSSDNRATIDQSGFPLGGNGLVILNAELRAPYHSFELVGFFDTGNVFRLPSQIDLRELRSSVGFGVRYKSPIGPIRVDLGFKTHRELIAGQREDLTAIQISLGQAF